jgi:hypothetical protein
MLVLNILVTAAMAAALVFLVKLRIGAGAGKRPDAIPDSFDAVQLMPGDLCCEQARNFSSMPMLKSEAPILPLSGCNRRKCECKYRKHVGDRRQQHRRRADDGLLDDVRFAGDNHRSGDDRRTLPG